jgi:hypothetical protein
VQAQGFDVRVERCRLLFDQHPQKHLNVSGRLGHAINEDGGGTSSRRCSTAMASALSCAPRPPSGTISSRNVRRPVASSGASRPRPIRNAPFTQHAWAIELRIGGRKHGALQSTGAVGDDDPGHLLTFLRRPYAQCRDDAGHTHGRLVGMINELGDGQRTKFLGKAFGMPLDFVRSHTVEAEVRQLQGGRRFRVASPARRASGPYPPQYQLQSTPR